MEQIQTRHNVHTTLVSLVKAKAKHFCFIIDNSSQNPYSGYNTMHYCRQKKKPIDNHDWCRELCIYAHNVHCTLSFPLKSNKQQQYRYVESEQASNMGFENFNTHYNID
jgi:hypothetical protein